MFAPGYACNGIALELFAVCSTLISHDTSRAALRQRYVDVRETGTGSRKAGRRSCASFASGVSSARSS